MTYGWSVKNKIFFLSVLSDLDINKTIPHPNFILFSISFFLFITSLLILFCVC